MNTSAYNQTCKCGHDIDTHHHFTTSSGVPLIGGCLAVGCNVPSDDWENVNVTSVCRYYKGPGATTGEQNVSR